MIGWVYLATAEPHAQRLCKVGYSAAPERRMKSLRIPGLRARPKLVTSWRVWSRGRAEWHAHAALADYAIGGEWFRLPEAEARLLIERRFAAGHILWNERKAWQTADGMLSDPGITLEEIEAWTGLAPDVLRKAKRK